MKMFNIQNVSVCKKVQIYQQSTQVKILKKTLLYNGPAVSAF